MSHLQKNLLIFLRELDKNNNKPWFEQHRPVFEAAKANFLEFNTELISKMQKMDNSLMGLDPKKTVFRINRDVRFSKDKSPYKNNMGTAMSKGGKNMMTAGYYFHLQPDNKSFAAIGSYMPAPEILQSIRQEIDYDLGAFKKIIQAASFKKYFDGFDDIERLKTVPKGYTSDNPAIEYLKTEVLLSPNTLQIRKFNHPIF
ncbi:MAG: DUF2461 domain-containing protein [Bacteroidetes bacterium]|nr:DUF2461 domain-containing protein [Bacteroidota bacterium]